jgi:hypothetical protein
VHKVHVKYKFAGRHAQGTQQLELVFRGQDEAILEHAFDTTSYGCPIVVEKHIDVPRSRMDQA